MMNSKTNRSDGSNQEIVFESSWRPIFISVEKTPTSASGE